MAIKIHVVRQTISKWEKGLSVPDADTLSKLADVDKRFVKKALKRCVLPPVYTKSCSDLISVTCIKD